MRCPCGFAHNKPSDTNCKQCGQPLEALRRKDRRERGLESDEAPVSASPRRREAPSARAHRLESAGSVPIPLRVDEPFSLGRAPECSLTIPSKRVSRQHAEVVWRSGLPVIRNVSESNSTLVNGKAVDEHELRDGDEIEVGPYSCTYRGSGTGSAQRAEEEMGETAVDEQDEALTGSLEQMHLFSLLRAFELHKKTGTLTLQSGGREGRVVLQKGRIQSAQVDALSGVGALHELLRWSEGTFAFSLEVKKGGGRLIRKFDYSGGADEGGSLRVKTITRLLVDAEKAGIREPAPKQSAPAPKPKAPARSAPPTLAPRPIKRHRPPP